MTHTLDLPFQLGETRAHGGVALTPLFPRQDPVCDYISLDEALTQGLAIGEVDEQGDVTQLLVRNPIDRGVLLYDGEELVGAKQNRILNVTVLIAAQSDSRIPVSCVEQGRWSWRGHRFASAGHVVGPELRARKAMHLHADALAPGAVQGEVWATVREQLVDRGVTSPTAANADAFAVQREQVGDLVSSFPLEAGQCGVIAAVAGRGWCLDLVSRPAVFSALYRKLVAGYLFDAVDPVGPLAEPGEVVAVLAAGRATRRPSVAVGEDLRVEGKGFLGSGLADGDELVQLSAYGARP